MNPTPWLGILSDTHGLIRPEILAALKGADLILHAGDVGSQEVLRELEHLAPVYHVRGNCDRPSLAHDWPWDRYLEWQGFTLAITHDLSLFHGDPALMGIHLMIHGHTHNPASYQKDGVLYLNPGSAGTGNRPYSLSYARLDLQNNRLHPTIITL